MKIKTLFTALFTLILFVACDTDDGKETHLALHEIPTAIHEYVEFHFPDNPIIRAKKEIDKGRISYEIYLEGRFELEFNEALEIVEIDGSSKLPDSVIPEPILIYVGANYPNNVITDWEIKSDRQEVGLDNNVDLIFDLDGNFLRIDND